VGKYCVIFTHRKSIKYVYISVRMGWLYILGVLLGQEAIYRTLN